ncbi:hypothetical protein [Deinococcus ruber]|uniref:DUF3347 domain-containing protein n=1 Tax=Deinococcus ruber TaxID=1848197 RepID=A0A918CDA6_9DEIO|nr:hypothetical protein [Deinococcus ruber]GGR18562.1 hypothetical protein GCM10008957_33960 [Deinococcus ruber]
MFRSLLAATFMLCCLSVQAQLRTGGDTVPGLLQPPATHQSVPMNPFASTSPQLSAARPVLELLVTLAQLRTQAAALALTPEQVGALRHTLAPLLDGTELQAGEADSLRAALLEALTPAQRQQLADQREAQTARLRALLSRARLASDEGGPQTARFAYSQWVGSAAVSALLADLRPVTVTHTVWAAALLTDQALSGV